MRDWIFAALLAIAGALVVVGVAGWSTPAAFIVAGALLACWVYLVFVVGEAGVPSPSHPAVAAPLREVDVA